MPLIYQRIVDTYRKYHLEEFKKTLKIPKGCRFNFMNSEGGKETFVLPQSLIYDPQRKQWFAVKPHTPKEKASRLHSLQSKGTLFSRLAPINLADAVSPQPLPDDRYTQTKKTQVITPELESKKEQISARVAKVAELTTLGFEAISGEGSGFRADCFERTTVSKKYQLPMLKIETVTDFVPGDDLIDFLRKYPQDLLGIVEIITRLLWAVMLLQNRGIVHCDLKPEHFIVMVKDNTVEKIMAIDFEFGDIEYAPNGNGTLEYASPEVFRKDPVSFPADAFSMGVITSILLSVGGPFQKRVQNMSIIDARIYEISAQINSMSKQLGEGCKENSQYKALYEQYLALIEQRKRIIGSIPCLKFDEMTKGAMRKAFHELKDQSLMVRVAPLLQRMIEVINALTAPNVRHEMADDSAEPDVEYRISVEDAYFSFLAIKEELTKLLEPHQESQQAPQPEVSPQQPPVPLFGQPQSLTLFPVPPASTPEVNMSEIAVSSSLEEKATTQPTSATV